MNMGRQVQRTWPTCCLMTAVARLQNEAAVQTTHKFLDSFLV